MPTNPTTPSGKVVTTPDLVMGITGASGAPYAMRLLDSLVRAGRTVHLTISPSAVQVFQLETDIEIDIGNFQPNRLFPDYETSKDSGTIQYHHFMDFRAGIASGSFLTGGMVICPCSMGTLAAIANGLSQNLIHRAADVQLKEKRPLVLVPRETPLSLVQLRNMTACVQAGATVLPAMPAFYTRPKTLEDTIDFIAGRICDHLGVQHELFTRWSEE